MPKPAMKSERGAIKQEGLPAMTYAIIALIGLVIAIGLLLFYVYQVPKMQQSGVQNQVFYILLLPWGLSCSAFLFGAMRSIAVFTHKKMGSALELGGPVVLFCLVVAGGFKLVPSTQETFDLTVRVHSASNPMITKGKITIDFGSDRRSQDIGPNGEANFKGIPAKFRIEPIKVLAQSTGYKEDWQSQKPSGNTLDLLLEPASAPKSHLSGNIIPPPRDWSKLRVTIQGQTTEATVDELGRFDIPATGEDGSSVELLVYDGRHNLIYSGNHPLGTTANIKLHRELANR